MTSRGEKEGWEKRRRRVADRIERTALELFGDRGYNEVTLAEVAAAAGVSARTLTRYFPLKEDLLLSQPRRSAEVALAQLAEASASGEDAMAALWQMWIGLARADPEGLDLLRLWFRAVGTAPQALARGGAEMSLIVRTSLGDVAARVLQVPPDDVRAQVLAAALVAAQEVVMQVWLRDGSGSDLSELFALAIDGLHRGFAFAGSSADNRRPRRGSAAAR